MSSDVARTDEAIVAGSSRFSDDEVQAFWEKSWKTLGRAAKVDIGEHDTLIKMWAERVKLSGHKLAIECLGGGLTYNDVDEMSDRFATYLINRPFLERGDCVALMLPNLSQYLVAIIGLLKAGMVGININPLYTKTEIENVLNDSKAQLLLTLANLASVPAGAHAPHLKEVIVTEVADCLPTTKRILINFMIRYVKRMVPKYRFDKRIIVSRFLSICDVDVSASREKLDSILPPTFSFISSFPYFFTAMLLLYFLGFKMGWFPIRHAYNSNLIPGLNMAFIKSCIHHAILPASTLIFMGIGGWMLQMRNNMMGTISTDYISFAKSKGLSQKRIMIFYAARNAILPIVTSFGMAIGFILNGTILTEIIFSYPGQGYILFQAVQAQDFQLMQGIFLTITLAVLAANWLIDILVL
ncbi:MAG: hypothetical protein CMP10_17785, partial [Zetaproteobacteria bacterium]|nr:hypothetical protein [Pseudobdellovibrionaceae bacterium]